MDREKIFKIAYDVAVATTRSFRRGVADKKAGILEPRPGEYPGTEEYKNYVVGYLITPWGNKKDENTSYR